MPVERRRQDGGGDLGGAGYGGDDNTTGMSGSGSQAGEPPAPSAGRPTVNPDDKFGSSLWGRTFHDRAALVEAYYTGAEGPIPLSVRLQSFRNSFAEQGDASLDQWVLDYMMSWSGQEPIAGVGSVEADVQKIRPVTGGQVGNKGKTVSAWLEFLRTADADKVSEIQRLLRDAGYMPTDVYKHPELLQIGVYDEYTQAAWTRMLKDGVMAGDTSMMETIRRRKEAIDAAGGIDAWFKSQEPERDPFVAQLTDARDITEAGAQVATDLTGHDNRAFGASLVGGYQGAEEAAQRAAYDAVETGGTITAPPSLGAYAEDQLRRRDPTQVDSYSALGAFNVIMQDLGLAG